MRHFAEQGYDAVRVGYIAAELGIAKGSIFQHFGSKDGIVFEVYKKAVRSFPTYLAAPAEARERGFYEVLRNWLVSTEHLLREDWIPYRVSILGNHGTDLTLKREINHFLMADDPGLPVHRSRAVWDFVQQQRGRLWLEFLPAYAPELNPVEYLGSHWKQHELPNFCPTTFGQLSHYARQALRRMRRRPTLVIAFWQQADLFSL
jgi:AcrR family transcriptional regulator